uniref:Cytochrome p450 n=1 Tax=Sipha flava TaxID=143950 RepID=A0A2S2R5A9_9HEMI
MGAYLMTLALEALAFAVFVALAAVVPYVRRKRGYWTSRGVTVATGARALAATVPGIRLDEKSLARYRDKAAAATLVGLHDAGRPCALACDVRVAAAALGNDGFIEPLGRTGAGSLIPRVVNAETVTAMLPAMCEAVTELITSLEALANLRQTIGPWTYAKKCSITTVATCVYGQPMIDSRVNAFAEQCDKALQRPAVTDYFTTYDLSSISGRGASSTDFKQLLREAAAADQNESSDVTDKQVRQDMFEFITGAIEPTAALVTAALYVLSRDQNIQDKLREHLDVVLDKHQQRITIDQLDRLTYLENVLEETLRKYPLVAVVRRLTTKSYVVPDGGQSVLEPGTLVAVPVHAFHHDQTHFTAPEMFLPDRFPGQLSSAYMPYGSGLRSHIGKHFVAVEVKLIIAMLVSRYAIHVDSDVPGRSPDPFDRTSFAGVRVKLTNHNGVKEPAMYESLRKCHRGNKKFLLFR